MTKIVAGVIGSLGIALMIVGVCYQGRAISRYGRPELKRVSFNPKNWRPIWNCAGQFTDEAGFRMYIKGDSIRDFGMIVTLIVIAYANGEGW